MQTETILYSERQSVFCKLTKVEREVLQLLCEGLTTKEIAIARGVGVKTIDTQRANINYKFFPRGDATPVKIFRKAIEFGIVSCPCRKCPQPRAMELAYFLEAAAARASQAGPDVRPLNAGEPGRAGGQAGAPVAARVDR